MIAAVSGGLYDDSAACAARWGGQQGGTWESVRRWHRIVTDLFPNYRKRYEALAALWHQIHTARRKLHGV
jgi:hypothetical protein